MSQTDPSVIISKRRDSVVPRIANVTRSVLMNSPGSIETGRYTNRCAAWVKAGLDFCNRLHERGSSPNMSATRLILRLVSRRRTAEGVENDNRWLRIRGSSNKRKKRPREILPLCRSPRALDGFRREASSRRASFEQPAIDLASMQQGRVNVRQPRLVFAEGSTASGRDASSRRASL